MKPPSRLGAAIAAALLVATTLLVSTLLRSPLPLLPLLPCLPAVTAPSGSGYEPAGLAALADAAVYYATTPTVPQQSRAEIALSLAVLPPPCAGAAAGSPFLRAHLVSYSTRLDQADHLLESYRRSPPPASLAPAPSPPSGATRRAAGPARPAAGGVRERVGHDHAGRPKGYFASAPGRMAAIWTAAAMARARSGEGDTDVFLHDVDRKVEKAYAEEFLCDRFKVEAAGRLWHFSIPPVSRRETRRRPAMARGRFADSYEERKARDFFILFFTPYIESSALAQA
ncbi:hypothetical protein ACQ4PT_014476 [Festuca glaucescens]